LQGFGLGPLVGRLVEKKISLVEKWDPYLQGIGLELGSKPTNRKQSWYNPADEIIILVSLKRPGPAEASFLDYAFENRADGTAFIAHYLFACAGVRTANGQIHGVTNRIREGKDNKASAIIMSFLSLVGGKPLISHRDEKLDFRFILNQRVFETTFTVNSTDLFDGTETVIHGPTHVDEPTPAVLPCCKISIDRPIPLARSSPARPNSIRNTRRACHAANAFRRPHPATPHLAAAPRLCQGLGPQYYPLHYQLGTIPIPDFVAMRYH
jgi:hypothetical protein